MRHFIAVPMAVGMLCGPAIAQPGNFARELLDAHNEARGHVDAEPLKWSGKLAREAQDWAGRLAREGQMRHADHASRNGAGENLWMGSAGYYGADEMVASFVEEKRHYRPGTFPSISRTGNWRDVGHYTQIIWRGTREVGCAVAKGGRNDFLVCRYWPAGNTYGVAMK